jgi:4-alpha-glucanotransferase
VDFDIDGIEEDCVCYTGTHDNDTSEGWFAGSGRLSERALAQRRSVVIRNVEGAGSSIHKAIISLCFRTESRIAVAPLQDYLGLGSEARLNTPGKPHGNWRWRAVEADLAEVDCAYVGDLARGTGRT